DREVRDRPDHAEQDRDDAEERPVRADVPGEEARPREGHGHRAPQVALLAHPTGPRDIAGPYHGPPPLRAVLGWHDGRMAEAVPCLLGATASGKSEVAVHAARATGGEVVACDAFAVYRGMAVLAAAPAAPPDVPHHLVGTVEPTEAYSAARFVEDADRACRE